MISWWRALIIASAEVLVVIAILGAVSLMVMYAFFAIQYLINF